MKRETKMKREREMKREIKGREGPGGVSGRLC